MAESLTDLLRQRDRLDAVARERIQPLWATLQEELGIPDDLKTPAPGPILSLDGDRLILPLEVRVPGTAWEPERRAQMRFAIPELAVASDAAVAREVLRREFPLQCTRCGLVHRAGCSHCQSPATCWGRLVWRTVSPQPSFYVETEGNYGYFSPGPRGLRYAIDLNDLSIFGVQYTLRNKPKWVTPIPEVVRDIVIRISESVLTDLEQALRGEMTGYAEAACLSFNPPSWCAEARDQLVARHANVNLRLLP